MLHLFLVFIKQIKTKNTRQENTKRKIIATGQFRCIFTVIFPFELHWSSSCYLVPINFFFLNINPMYMYLYIAVLIRKSWLRASISISLTVKQVLKRHCRCLLLEANEMKTSHIQQQQSKIDYFKLLGMCYHILHFHELE